jgi:hypothetical protein
LSACADATSCPNGFSTTTRLAQPERPSSPTTVENGLGRIARYSSGHAQGKRLTQAVELAASQSPSM